MELVLLLWREELTAPRHGDLDWGVCEGGVVRL